MRQKREAPQALGGYARAAALTAKQLSEQGRYAVTERWKRAGAGERQSKALKAWWKSPAGRALRKSMRERRAAARSAAQSRKGQAACAMRSRSHVRKHRRRVRAEHGGGPEVASE